MARFKNSPGHCCCGVSGLADYYAKFAFTSTADVTNNLSNFVPFSSNFQTQSICEFPQTFGVLQQHGCELINVPEDVPTLMMDDVFPMRDVAFWDRHFKQNNNASEISYHLRRRCPQHPDYEKLGYEESWEANKIDRIFNDNLHSFSGSEWQKEAFIRVLPDGQTIEVDTGGAIGEILTAQQQDNLRLTWESDFIYKIPTTTSLKTLTLHMAIAQREVGFWQFGQFQLNVRSTPQVGLSDFSNQYLVDRFNGTVETQFGGGVNQNTELIYTSRSAGEGWLNWHYLNLRFPTFDEDNTELRQFAVTIKPITNRNGAQIKLGGFLLTTDDFSFPATIVETDYYVPVDMVRSEIRGSLGDNTTYEKVSFDPENRMIDGIEYWPIGKEQGERDGFRIRHSGGIGWMRLGGTLAFAEHQGELLSIDFPSDPGPPIDIRNFRTGNHDDESEVDNADYTNVSDLTEVGATTYLGYQTRDVSDTELPIVFDIARHDFPNGIALIHSGFRQLLPAPQTPFYSTGPDPGQNAFVNLQRSRESITNTIQIVRGEPVREIDPDSGDGVLRLENTSVLYSVSSTQDRVCTWVWGGNINGWLRPTSIFGDDREGGIDWRPNMSSANVQIDILDADGYDGKGIVSFIRYDRTANITGPTYADSRSIDAGGSDITEAVSTTRKICVAVDGVLKSEQDTSAAGGIQSNVAYTDGGAIWFVYDEGTDRVTMHVDDGVSPVSLTSDIDKVNIALWSTAKVVGFTRDRFYVRDFELSDQLSSGTMFAWMFSYDLTIQVPVHRMLVDKEDVDVSNPANWPIRSFVGDTISSETTCPIDNIDGLDFCPQTSDFGKMGEPPENSKWPSRVPIGS